jgi:hypothetical protein
MKLTHQQIFYENEEFEQVQLNMNSKSNDMQKIRFKIFNDMQLMTCKKLLVFILTCHRTVTSAVTLNFCFETFTSVCLAFKYTGTIALKKALPSTL